MVGAGVSSETAGVGTSAPLARVKLNVVFISTRILGSKVDSVPVSRMLPASALASVIDSASG